MNLSEHWYDADSGSDTDSEDDLEELEYFNAKRNLDEIKQSRYWAPRKYRKSDDTVFKKHEETSDGCFFNDNEFKEQYRCSRDAFEWILQQIEDHPVFNNAPDRKGRKQTPARQQLMILLHFLGMESSTNRTQRAVY